MIKTLPEKLIGLLFISLCLLACESEKSPYFSPILKSEKGNFRGIAIGATFHEVQQVENDSFLIDQMEDYLHYEYVFEMGNSYTVTYDFSSEGRLYEIETTAYFDLVDDATLLFKHFENYFHQQYGKSKKEEDGYTVWKTTHQKTNSNMEIAMIDQSVSYGIITIKIRDLDY